MTPFGLRLHTELDNEFARMASEWFFPWHGLNSGRGVSVDNFNGQRIQLSGILFDGCEPVYWAAIKRHLSNKISEVFDLAEKEIRLSPGSKIIAVAEDAANVIEVYCARIRSHAIETERALKGRGFPDRSYSSAIGERLDLRGEILGRKRALVEFYGQSEPRAVKDRKFEKFIEANKGKLQLLGGIGALMTILATCLRLLGVF
jgi:hypothetical protein